MATLDTGSAETTIMVEAVAVKSELVELQREIEGFLHSTSPDCEQKSPMPCYPDPISEIVATLQDCKKLVFDIRHLALDRIANRIKKESVKN